MVNPKVQLYKPSSVPAWRRVAIISLDQPLPTGSPANGKRPTRRPSGLGPLAPGPGATRVDRLLGLAGGGVFPAGDVAAAAVRSYRTISPLPEPREGPSAVCFLWHYPWVRRPSLVRESRLPVAVSHHRALPCSDFPPRPAQGHARRPPEPPLGIYDYYCTTSGLTLRACNRLDALMCGFYTAPDMGVRTLRSTASRTAMF
jgi:hypothetical protein